MTPRKKPKVPVINESEASSFLGKYILVGITYCDHQGKETDHVQMHGLIKSISTNGVLIDLRGSRNGTTWSMPPDLSSIRPAKPGNYTLHSTNETVENPDFLCTWVVHSPPPAP